MAEPSQEKPSFEALYAQIEALREGVTGEILVDGVLRTMPRPGAAHRRASRVLGDGLKPCDLNFGGVGWWLETEVEVRLPSDKLVVPDWSGWQVETEPEFIERNPVLVPPQWVCEILSPSNGREDRLLKLPLYARSGVAHVWLIDPEQRALEVYETGSGMPVLIGAGTDEETVAPPPFELPLDLGRLWRS